MKFVVLEAEGPPGTGDAFVVCDQQGKVLAAAEGKEVFRWGDSAWLDADLWSWVPAELRRERPRFFDYAVITGILATAQSKGFRGPPALPALAEWAGVDLSRFDLTSPLARCRLLATILGEKLLRTPR